MSKTLLFLALCCLYLVLIRAQALTDREYCARVTRECQRLEPTVGPNDDTVGFYNNWCRGFNPNWRNITRCQLVGAACQLTLVRCTNLTCDNVRGVL